MFGSVPARLFDYLAELFEYLTRHLFPTPGSTPLGDGRSIPSCPERAHERRFERGLIEGRNNESIIFRRQHIADAADAG
jgi:hypothetical protein